MSLYKNKLFKVKRKHVEWNDVRIEIGDLDVNAAFYRLLTKHPTWSKNRLSYQALRNYYSPTAMYQMRCDYGV